MRITAGVARGVPLDCPKCARPTLDKVKQAMFNSLYSLIDFKDLNVLDLFAGSGALGVEALSRGAAKTVFVDKSKEACEVIQKNIDNSKIQAEYSIFRTDFEKFKSKDKFDIIFLDPPYGTGMLEKALNVIAEMVNNLIVCESNEKITYSNNLECVSEKKYGTVFVSILRKKQ